ncbi:MAG: sulfatase-like hydrolase/transferase [Candidatus Altiarchaeales archaeon]|nr:sulfatase-like hydrolase/transferase [Candidatus Altiarchaeales archaeon]
MKSKNTYRLAVLFAATICCMCLDNPAEPGMGEVTCPGCNVIVVSVDALRKDHLGCYGYDRDVSPNIDKLASASYVFQNAYSQCSWTRPSMASMLTSKHPPSHGVLTESRDSFIDDSQPLIQKTFFENGYDTAAFIANPNLYSDFGFNKGFMYFYELPGVFRAGKVLEYAANWTYDNKDKPFFMWIHLQVPHDTYEPPGPYQDFYTKDCVSNLHPLNTTRERIMTPPRYDVSVSANLSEGDICRMVGLYDGEVAVVNDALGVFFHRLSLMGLSNNTIIVFTADHGEEFLDHGSLYHGATVYNELVEVPLILYVPGHPGIKINKTVELIDLYPALTQLVGIKTPETLEGINLFSKKRKPAYTETRFRTVAYKSLMTVEGYKIIENQKTGETEVYNLEHDPLELNDLSAQKTGLRDKLLKQFKDFQMNLPQYTPTDSAPVSNDTLNRLEELGYLI